MEWKANGLIKQGRLGRHGRRACPNKRIRQLVLKGWHGRPYGSCNAGASLDNEVQPDRDSLTASFDGEIPLPHLKVTVSDHQNNTLGVQWQRYWDDAPYPDLVKIVPHVAFEVDNLAEASEAPDDLPDGLRESLSRALQARLRLTSGPAGQEARDAIFDALRAVIEMLADIDGGERTRRLRRQLDRVECQSACCLPFVGCRPDELACPCNDAAVKLFRAVLRRLELRKTDAEREARKASRGGHATGASSCGSRSSPSWLVRGVLLRNPGLYQIDRREDSTTLARKPFSRQHRSQPPADSARRKAATVSGTAGKGSSPCPSHHASKMRRSAW
jgi:hypothetical protein